MNLKTRMRDLSRRIAGMPLVALSLVCALGAPSFSSPSLTAESVSSASLPPVVRAIIPPAGSYDGLLELGAGASGVMLTVESPDSTRVSHIHGYAFGPLFSRVYELSGKIYFDGRVELDVWSSAREGEENDVWLELTGSVELSRGAIYPYECKSREATFLYLRPATNELPPFFPPDEVAH